MADENKIIVKFVENESCQLSQDNDVSEIHVTGVIKVINPSDKSRIWNAVLKLDNVEGTSITEKELNVGEVNMKSEWTKEYTVTDITEPILKVQEIIDTEPGTKEEITHDALAYNADTTVAFTIRLTNLSDTHIKNIEVVKKVPDVFENLDIEKPDSGVVEYNPGIKSIVWKGFELYPNGEAELRFSANIRPTRSEPYDGGPLTVSYEVDGMTRSKLEPTLIAETSAFVGGDVSEDPRQPNQWICRFEFINDSTFPLRINRAVIYQVHTDETKEVIVEDYPNILVAPGQSWIKETTIVSPEFPTIEREVDYSVEFDVERVTYGKIEKTPKVLPVAKVDGALELDPPSVHAYTKTPIEATLEVTNSGSATLDEIVVIVDVPKDFKAPIPENIEVLKKTTPLEKEIEITPGDEDPTKPHTVTIRIPNLISSIEGLKPGEKITIKFPLIAWIPKPNVDYNITYHIKGNVERPIRYTVYESEPIKVEIKYVPRGLAPYKTVQAGKSSGEYVIPLKLVNKGEVRAENVVLSDFVPEGFEVVDWEPKDREPTITDVEGGKIISWTFRTIEKGEEIEIRYVIRGTGKYVRREPKVTSTPK
ncbi:MAG: hypothetical protein ACP6IS_04725 [Candidatus Asgardarchaeia archaeon]